MFMGVTRTDLFSDEFNHIAIVAKSISHPARIAIIKHLLRVKHCINRDMVRETGLSQPAVSQHLNALKNSGIIQGEIQKNTIIYRIDPTGWKRVTSLLKNLFEENPHS